MRKLSLYAFISFLFLWGVNLYIIHDDNNLPKLAMPKKMNPDRKVASEPTEVKNSDSDVLKEGNLRNIDKIGDVINEQTVKLDQEVKVQIKNEKIAFDNTANISEKTTLLEQSFLDKNSSVKDIKRLQSEIQDLKVAMKLGVNNTEKWDPMFVYYLMISENYTYSEINQIRSLSENGISEEELNYINDLIKQETFKTQVLGYKNKGEVGKVVASFKKTKPKQADEFIEGAEGSTAVEDKLIEMNYGQTDK
jgi:hypothetical protein